MISSRYVIPISTVLPGIETIIESDERSRAARHATSPAAALNGMAPAIHMYAETDSLARSSCSLVRALADDRFPGSGLSFATSDGNALANQDATEPPTPRRGHGGRGDSVFPAGIGSVGVRGETMPAVKRVKRMGQGWRVEDATPLK